MPVTKTKALISQLRGYREADLRLWFRIPQDAAHNCPGALFY